MTAVNRALVDWSGSLGVTVRTGPGPRALAYCLGIKCTPILERRGSHSSSPSQRRNRWGWAVTTLSSVSTSSVSWETLPENVLEELTEILTQAQ